MIPAPRLLRRPRRTLEAWRARGFDGTSRFVRASCRPRWRFAINLFDTFVHGWDIAEATGQDAELDDRLCAALLGFMPSLAPAFVAGDNFGPAFDVPVAPGRRPTARIPRPQA